jgi:hypothetical protein
VSSAQGDFQYQRSERADTITGMTDGNALKEFPDPKRKTTSSLLGRADK